MQLLYQLLNIWCTGVSGDSGVTINASENSTWCGYLFKWLYVMIIKVFHSVYAAESKNCLSIDAQPTEVQSLNIFFCKEASDQTEHCNVCTKMLLLIKVGNKKIFIFSRLFCHIFLQLKRFHSLTLKGIEILLLLWKSFAQLRVEECNLIISLALCRSNALVASQAGWSQKSQKTISSHHFSVEDHIHFNPVHSNFHFLI